MKNIKFKKLNIFVLILVLSLNSISFSDSLIEQYGPAADSHNSETVSAEMLDQVVSDADFNEKLGTGKMSSADIEAIKQIVVAEPTTKAIVQSQNIATPVVNPASIIYQPQNNIMPAEVSSNQMILQSPISNSISANTLTTKTITNTKIQDIQAPSYALINATTKEIYAVKNTNSKYNPSGLVNLMTAYIATKHLNMNSILNVNASAVKNLDKDASIAALSAGDTITLKDAIASMFVKGCVDSANVVAENVSGSIKDFVDLMNVTASTLGLTNTKFVDPSGIGQNESSATDIAIITAKVCENPELVDLLKLHHYTLPKVNKRDTLILYSKNTQLSKSSSSYNSDVTASRLAYTSASKYCITSLMQVNNNNYIAVVLKAEGSQFSATKRLFEFAKSADGIITSKN